MNYILERYRGEHPDEGIVKLNIIDAQAVLERDVQVHKMLNWIGAAGWTLSNMSGTYPKGETYLFTRRLE
jgi:hypothetical protein